MWSTWSTLSTRSKLLSGTKWSIWWKWPTRSKVDQYDQLNQFDQYDQTRSKVDQSSVDQSNQVIMLIKVSKAKKWQCRLKWSTSSKECQRTQFD